MWREIPLTVGDRQNSQIMRQLQSRMMTASVIRDSTSSALRGPTPAYSGAAAIVLTLMKWLGVCNSTLVLGKCMCHKVCGLAEATCTAFPSSDSRRR